MRILLSTIGSRGDVQPLVALATELRALGHEARFCVPPDFCEWIASLGFTAVPIGPRLRPTAAAATDPGAAASSSPSSPPLTTMTAEQRRQLAEASVVAQFETIATAADGCDTIVAATALQMAARSVAEVRGIGYVFVAYCPAVLPSPYHPPPPLPAIPGQPAPPPASGNAELWAREAERFNALFGPALNAQRQRLGLSAVDDVRGHIFSDHPWLAADAALAPWDDPDNTAVFQPGAFVLADDRPLAPELEAFLDAGDPPIYFGLGSMRAPQAFGDILLAAARSLGRRVIVSRGWAGLSVTDGALDCLAIDEVNQQALFPRVAAIVHHGGAGTTTAAALSGTAQVVMPQMYDQHYFAARVAELGLGVSLPPGAPASTDLVSALERALAPGLKAQAAAFAPRVGRAGARAAALLLLGA